MDKNVKKKLNVLDKKLFHKCNYCCMKHKRRKKNEKKTTNTQFLAIFFLREAVMFIPKVRYHIAKYIHFSDGGSVLWEMRLSCYF